MGTSDPKNGGGPPEAEGFRVEDRRVSTNPERAEESPQPAADEAGCACGASPQDTGDECEHAPGHAADSGR